MKTFGQRIKELRREAGLSQSELSERIGVSVQSISKWENDNTMPDISQIVPLAAVLGVSTDWILGVGINEEKDRRELEAKIEEIRKTHSQNTRDENADLLSYEATAEFLKRYPLCSREKLSAAKYLETYLQNSKLTFHIPHDKFESLHLDGVRLLNSVIAQDNDPGRLIDARLSLIEYLKMTREFDEAERVASELPETYAIRDEALLGIACEKSDYILAEEISQKVSRRRAYEYLKAMSLRARRISIYGKVRKAEAVNAWAQMVDEAKDLVEIFGDEIPEFWIIVKDFLVEAITSEACDYLVMSDVDSALKCVEEATDIAISAYERIKKSGASKDELLKYAGDCAWVPIMCYSKVIANSDNVLSREARFKACQKRIAELA